MDSRLALTQCSECGREYRTDERIFEQSQTLAAKFYELLGYKSPEINNQPRKVSKKPIKLIANSPLDVRY